MLNNSAIDPCVKGHFSTHYTFSIAVWGLVLFLSVYPSVAPWLNPPPLAPSPLVIIPPSKVPPFFMLLSGAQKHDKRVH